MKNYSFAFRVQFLIYVFTGLLDYSGVELVRRPNFRGAASRLNFFFSAEAFRRSFKFFGGWLALFSIF